MTLAAIRFENVSQKFGKLVLIDKVSFVVERGSLTTLIGPNGAGKTTIAKLILGLMKPSSGSITVDETLKVGYVPQQSSINRNLPCTVESFINLLAPEWAESDANKFTSLIDLPAIKKQDISSLSGGQMQKLLIVSALLSKPDLLILDEPVQFLDVISQQEFYKIITKLRKDCGATIFMISHDLFTILKASDQVLCLNGHICCSSKGLTLESIEQNSDFVSALSAMGLYTHHHDHKHN